MRGQVETPAAVVDKMVAYLFRRLPPEADHGLLDAGCGEGAFIEGVIRWCRSKGRPIPGILGVEQDPEVARFAQEKFQGIPEVTIVTEDYLQFTPDGGFDYVVGNPPYVGLTQIGEEERQLLRRRFRSAQGRFDLYMLFFEHALTQLKENGRLVFVTPEKWIYVDSARRLREFVSSQHVELLEFLPENTFPGKITYPAIAMIRKRGPRRASTIISKGGTRSVDLRNAGDGSWLGLINGSWSASGTAALREACERIGVGIATGAERVFCLPKAKLPASLEPFARPTVAGRDLNIELGGPIDVSGIKDVMLVPYDSNGRLISEQELGSLGRYLNQDAIRAKLIQRTCARRKPWYAFHDTIKPSLIFRPKLLCKDICSRPVFWIDTSGDILPRHSVYYLVPSNPDLLYPLAEWLNSRRAGEWLRQHAQRAANGYLRLQAGVLRQLPIPRRFLE